MKTLALSALVLSVTTNAFAAGQAVQGKKILSCSASDGDYVELAIFANPDRSLRASVTEESFGGSYPTFHYDVKKLANGDFEGKGFSLKMKADRQAKLVIDGNANEMDCR
jgi:hypothetical protein